MKTVEKKLAKEMILAQIAAVMLRDQDLKLEVKARARMINQELIKRLPPEQYKTIVDCKNIIDKLGEKLIACEDPETLQRTLAFVSALNTGDVYETDEQLIVEGE